jgi:hypothetical protein
VWLEKFKFKRALYMMFQNPGPQHETWGQPFVTVLLLCVCLLEEKQPCLWSSWETGYIDFRGIVKGKR